MLDYYFFSVLLMFIQQLPPGSNFRVELPFNGAGVMDYGGYSGDPLFLKARQILPRFFWQRYASRLFHW